MHIGSVQLDSPFILAPLAGYTDLPFRLLCREYGASLCYSEMISCHGLAYDQNKTKEMLVSHPDERPVAMQLFGADPEIMGSAAAIMAKEPIDIIDINMGCPVKKVIKRGAGAALMRDPKLAYQIIAAVCKNTDKPVTVKFRSGWTHHTENAPEFALMAQEAGASAVIVHARTWSDGFSGHPDWEIIAKVKKMISIPVIGNGDILSYDTGLKMIRQTGCDAVMIGRGALGAPWIFSPAQPLAGMRLRTRALLRHLELIARFFEPDRFMGKVKNHAGRYFKGAPGSAGIRRQLFEARSFADLVSIVEMLQQKTM